jgi:hypothetical protein
VGILNPKLKSAKKTGKMMKQHQKWFATALAVAGGLVIAGSAQAQTQVLCDFQNFTLTTAYGSWETSPFPIPPWPSIINDGPFEVIAWGAGGGYYDIPLGDQQLFNASVGQVTLTLTLNSPDVSTAWLGVKFLLDDNQGNSDVRYGVYAGLWGVDNGSWENGNVGTVAWTGNTLTMTVPLAPAMVTGVQTGNDKITGFGLEIDPAYFSGGDGPYDITYDSLTASPVPEPAALALFAIGMAGFVIAQRRVS